MLLYEMHPSKEARNRRRNLDEVALHTKVVLIKCTFNGHDQSLSSRRVQVVSVRPPEIPWQTIRPQLNCCRKSLIRTRHDSPSMVTSVRSGQGYSGLVEIMMLRVLGR